MERLLYRVPEVAQMLGVSRAFLYREIAAGRLRTVKLGAATRIPAEELLRYVGQLQDNRASVPTGVLERGEVES